MTWFHSWILKRLPSCGLQAIALVTGIEIHSIQTYCFQGVHAFVGSGFLLSLSGSEQLNAKLSVWIPWEHVWAALRPMLAVISSGFSTHEMLQHIQPPERGCFVHSWDHMKGVPLTHDLFFFLVLSLDLEKWTNSAVSKVADYSKCEVNV